MLRGLSALASVGAFCLTVMAVGCAASVLPVGAILCAAAMVAVEAFKCCSLIAAFRRSEDGNIIGALVLAEGLSLAADVTAVSLALSPFRDADIVAAFSLCSVFLAVRLASALSSSRFLRR